MTEHTGKQATERKALESGASGESTMTMLYKLTDQNGQTYGETQWGPGVTHTAPGTGELCTNGWIHAYTDPLLAVFLNPIHANFQSPRLWECEGEVGADDHGLKVGCISLTTLRELPLPEVALDQRVRFAILCAIRDYSEPRWLAWAEGWLSGADRTAAAAAGAWFAARAAATAWAAAAEEAAAEAALAAKAAREAREAAREAAAAAGAVAAAASAAVDLDLAAIAQEAVGVPA